MQTKDKYEIELLMLANLSGSYSSVGKTMSHKFFKNLPKKHSLANYIYIYIYIYMCVCVCVCVCICIKLEITTTRKSGTKLHVTYGTLNSCLDLIRSHQLCTLWSPPLKIESTTTVCRSRNSITGPLVHATYKRYRINKSR